MTTSRITLVTGAASGIGRATARRFAEDGDFVIVADLNAEGGGAVVDEIKKAGGQAEFRAVDVANENSVNELAEAIEKDHGTIGALVNSAGILQNLSQLDSFDLTEHDRVWAINYRGSYLCCQAFGLRMANAGGGSIVNISSTSAIGAFPLIAYGPAKAAIDQLTAILASDLGPKGVRVNAVRPGYVLTEQMQSRIDSGFRNPQKMHDQSALGRMVKPDEIADGIHFLCSNAARAITGAVLPIDAGWFATVIYKQYPGWPG